MGRQAAESCKDHHGEGGLRVEARQEGGGWVSPRSALDYTVGRRDGNRMCRSTGTVDRA